MRSLLDVATGLQYLHGLGIVHGDLKAANVLLKSTNTDYRGFICKCVHTPRKPAALLQRCLLTFKTRPQLARLCLELVLS